MVIYFARKAFFASGGCCPVFAIACGEKMIVRTEKNGEKRLKEKIKTTQERREERVKMHYINFT